MASEQIDLRRNGPHPFAAIKHTAESFAVAAQFAIGLLLQLVDDVQVTPVIFGLVGTRNAVESVAQLALLGLVADVEVRICSVYSPLLPGV